mmetsp:Transcript_29754/g.46691  ORF Transcript_29754/g.46691 Transcript_29754/m.46691 type:complete len:83 (+) Transcript_29754:490-738(+)
MKKVRIEIHHTAMTAACMMVGVFYVDGGNQQHCVLIDDTDGAEGILAILCLGMRRGWHDVTKHWKCLESPSSVPYSSSRMST